ncbi:MAG: PAAR domain-containing protein [Anaerolineae bacterium]|nr:PAAR domain-containing protein [Anaerolineae bacterium]
MPFAARLGDLTSHGSPLGPTGGSINVFIGGQPAWRAIVDAHVCPLVSGTVPHAGGVVMKGSTSVLINNMPAARAGDQIVEAGPPNAIAQGCPTVQIGG